MPQPPTTPSVPPADVAEGEELTLRKIAQHINHTKHPWVMLLQDGRITLKIALVTSNEWQAAAQEEAFFPVLTVEEFVLFLGYAGRARAAGQPWTLKDLKAYGTLRVNAHRLIGPLAFLGMGPDVAPPKKKETP